ncbi:MAG: family 16 glycosylhydrolase, partial [Gammaproteobacteria bacterium]|nr:glycoside hydrolase family 16 protein [Actinomycetota bacterium]NIV45506.1 family 16 glycosylhydrolase [Gammaproteobacteria bacterium]NIW30120.1 family 16 glycosylhydrolase [Actinomycetota bacterium]
NATVADGFLTITAKEEAAGGYDYTSARMRSLGKGDWTFGRMEMRARMPIGQGLWPAFWMLPSDSVYGGWAASGEIDIVEYIGSQPNRILGTIHYGGPWPCNVYSTTSYFLPSGTFHDDFHVFAVEWELGEIRWYVDGMLYATRNSWYSTGGPFPAPFDVDFHLLLNLAVGGNLPGPPDATTVFPQEYVIDYVRVYQLPPAVAITSPTA